MRPCKRESYPRGRFFRACSILFRNLTSEKYHEAKIPIAGLHAIIDTESTVVLSRTSTIGPNAGQPAAGWSSPHRSIQHKSRPFESEPLRSFIVFSVVLRGVNTCGWSESMTRSPILHALHVSDRTECYSARLLEQTLGPDKTLLVHY
jgi:hypothetical protein